MLAPVLTPAKASIPGNNLVSNAAYDAFPGDSRGDFTRAEGLIATVYEALRANLELTLLDGHLILGRASEEGGPGEPSVEVSAGVSS